MAPKCRYPKDLGLHDFLTFVKDMVGWLLGEVGKPDYRASVVDGFDLKVSALETAVVAYSTLQSHVPELHKILDDKAKLIQKALQSMKTLLPVFFPDPAIVGEFGLAVDINLDNDDLYVIGMACLTHWGEVSADPAFAEVVSDFAELQTVFDEFVAARGNWLSHDQALDEAQNTILAERATVEEHERNIFNYYRAKHPDAKDEWWTDSPWGRTGESGGGGGDKLPAVTGFHLVFVDPNLTLAWDEVEGADGYELREGNNPLIMARTIYEGSETEFTYDPPGGHLYFRVWAKKGDEMGEPGDAIDIEIEGNPPGQPQNLHVELQPDGSLRITWDAPPEGSPEYCNLYIKDVETGQPAPTKPSEPYYDEMIVYQITISDPIPGRTYFVWVTAFDDGVEGEPAGPESVDII